MVVSLANEDCHACALDVHCTRELISAVIHRNRRNDRSKFDEVLRCQMMRSTSVASCGVVDAVLEISRRLHLQSFNHGDNTIISVPMNAAPIRCLVMFRVAVLDYSRQPESSIDAYKNDSSVLM